MNSLLKGTGLSLSRFTSFAQAENRVNPGSKGDRYPTSMDLLNLWGLPLPAQYHIDENQCLKQQLALQADIIHKLREKLDQLIDIQGQTSQHLKTLQGVISQTPGTKSVVMLTGPEPSIDDRQSIDNLLADDEGHEMEHDVPEPQQVEHRDVQMLDGSQVPLSPGDEALRMAVNSIIVDGEKQDQEQEVWNLGPQVPIDEYEVLNM